MTPPSSSTDYLGDHLHHTLIVASLSLTPSVRHPCSNMLDLLADDYFLFNPDLHEDKNKQQHSNFLMTPYKYTTIFVNLSSTVLFANNYIAGLTFFLTALPQGI